VRWEACDTTETIDAYNYNQSPIYEDSIAQHVVWESITINELANCTPMQCSGPWYTFSSPVLYEHAEHIAGSFDMTGLDLAVFHGNIRAVEKIFQLMSEGLYHCEIHANRREVILEAAAARSGWHMPNVYSERFPMDRDYDTDPTEKLIILAGA